LIPICLTTQRALRTPRTPVTPRANLLGSCAFACDVPTKPLKMKHVLHWFRHGCRSLSTHAHCPAEQLDLCRAGSASIDRLPESPTFHRSAGRQIITADEGSAQNLRASQNLMNFPILFHSCASRERKKRRSLPCTFLKAKPQRNRIRSRHLRTCAASQRKTDSASSATVRREAATAAEAKRRQAITPRRKPRQSSLERAEGQRSQHTADISPAVNG